MSDDLLEALVRIETRINFAIKDIERLDGKIDQVITLVTAQEGKIRVLEVIAQQNKKKSVETPNSSQHQLRKSRRFFAGIPPKVTNLISE